MASAHAITGRSDQDDCLVAADAPLTRAQQACGGTVPGAIALPALRELVVRARATRLRLGRRIELRTADEAIAAWADIRPDGEGCRIELTGWRAAPLADRRAPDPGAVAALDRFLAGFYARLDARQRIVACDVRMTECCDLARAAAGAPAAVWTSFVTLPQLAETRPLHWRLLDGAQVRIDGSDRLWRALLEPVGEEESDGFDLYLVPEAGEPPGGTRPALTPPAPRQSFAANEIAPALRQPIARIIANAETIRSRLAGPLPEAYGDYAADIATAGQHLLSLIEDFTDLEFIEAGRFTTAPDPIDLADVAARAIGILAVRAREKDIRLRLPAGARQPATGEFRRVLQILLNLIGNAVRYGPHGSTVLLELGHHGTNALLTVVDEGPGIAQEDQAKVFEKFERLGRTGDGGSGLGLYISRRLARAMGGDIAIDSRSGEGARFTLSLPLDGSGPPAQP